MANCIYCGEILQPGAAFCTNCGRKVENAPVMTAINYADFQLSAPGEIAPIEVETAPAEETAYVEPPVFVPEMEIPDVPEPAPAAIPAAVPEAKEKDFSGIYEKLDAVRSDLMTALQAEEEEIAALRASLAEKEETIAALQASEAEYKAALSRNQNYMLSQKEDLQKAENEKDAAAAESEERIRELTLEYEARINSLTAENEEKIHELTAEKEALEAARAEADFNLARAEANVKSLEAALSAKDMENAAKLESIPVPDIPAEAPEPAYVTEIPEEVPEPVIPPVPEAEFPTIHSAPEPDADAAEATIYSRPTAPEGLNPWGVGRPDSSSVYAEISVDTGMTNPQVSIPIPENLESSDVYNPWDSEFEDTEATMYVRPAAAAAPAPAEDAGQLPRFCENCGAPISDDMVFCTNCGKKIRA